MKQRQTSVNVVPFKGEMYPDPIPTATPPPSTNFNFLALFCVCLMGVGFALGSSVTYHSPEQTQIREIQGQAKQLNQIKKQLCTGA